MVTELGKPTLVVVSGPGGSGKTTLAHLLAHAIGCPAICRDEIKEGMAHATPGFRPRPNDPLTQRTFTTFFAVIELLLRAGVTVVAEAAFRDALWRSGLEPLTRLADLRVVQCVVGDEVAIERMTHRLAESAGRGAAHADVEALNTKGRSVDPFDRISLPVSSVWVDTTDGYRPALDDIVAFIG